MAYSDLTATFLLNGLLTHQNLSALGANDAYLYARMPRAAKAIVSGAGGVSGSLATILNVASGAGQLLGVVALGNAAATPVRLVVTLDGVAVADTTKTLNNAEYAWLTNQAIFANTVTAALFSVRLNFEFSTSLKVEACRTDAGTAPTIYVLYADSN